MSLLLKKKNINQRNSVPLPSHLVTSNDCECHRSFHIFCTHLFPEHDPITDMINLHPAPRAHDRDSTRRAPTPYQRHRHRHQEDNNQDTIFTSRSEPAHVPILVVESQPFERKVTMTTDRRIF